MQTASGSQTASTSWVTIDALSIDTNSGGETRLIYFLTAATNDVQVKIQGSVDNSTWVDIDTLDFTTNDVQGTILTVVSGASAVAIISPEHQNGIYSAWRRYRLQIKGSATYGVLTASLFAK